MRASFNLITKNNHQNRVVSYHICATAFVIVMTSMLPLEIVIEENAHNLLSTGALHTLLLDRKLRNGTVTLIIRDPDITMIGIIDADWESRTTAPCYECTSLVKLDLSGCSNLRIIGDYSFMDCKFLQTVLLPPCLNILGDRAFRWCSRLTSISIPDVTMLGEDSFQNCAEAAKGDVELRKHKSITRTFFPNEIIPIEDEEGQVSVISDGEEDTFQECAATQQQLDVWREHAKFALSSAATVTSGEVHESDGESKLILPEGVEELGDASFYEGSSLTTLVLPASLEQVGDLAFAFCVKLEEVELHTDKTNFSERTFFGCTRLVEIAERYGYMSSFDEYGDNKAQGVLPYLIEKFRRIQRRKFVLIAASKFNKIVHDSGGTERDKIEAARVLFPATFGTTETRTVGDFLKATRQGVKGVLGDIVGFI